MRLAVVSNDINAELPKGSIVFVISDLLKGNKYIIDSCAQIERSYFKNIGDLCYHVTYVFGNPDYDRNKKQFKKRSFSLAPILKKYNLDIDWKAESKRKINFTIKEKDGIELNFLIKKVKDIYYTLHLFYDILDAKIENIKHSKIR